MPELLGDRIPALGPFRSDVHDAVVPIRWRPVELRQACEANAAAWIAFARSEDADPVFWRFNLPAFLDLVPPRGRLTVDVGCGEGRVARALSSQAHRVVGVDTVPPLVAAARIPAIVGDAAALPLPPAIADLVVLFMMLTDVGDLHATVAEAARVPCREAWCASP